MTRAEARMLAAQAWCQPATRNTVMDADLAEEFAKIIESLTTPTPLDAAWRAGAEAMREAAARGLEAVHHKWHASAVAEAAQIIRSLPLPPPPFKVEEAGPRFRLEGAGLIDTVGGFDRCTGCGQLPPHAGCKAICAACAPPTGACYCAGCTVAGKGAAPPAETGEGDEKIEYLTRCPATPDGRLPPDEISSCEFCGGTAYCAGEAGAAYPPGLEPRICLRVTVDGDDQETLCAEPHGERQDDPAKVTCEKCKRLLTPAPAAPVEGGAVTPWGPTSKVFRDRHCAECLRECACGKGRDEPHREGCAHVCSHSFQQYAPPAPAPSSEPCPKK